MPALQMNRSRFLSILTKSLVLASLLGVSKPTRGKIIAVGSIVRNGPLDVALIGWEVDCTGTDIYCYEMTDDGRVFIAGYSEGELAQMTDALAA